MDNIKKFEGFLDRMQGLLDNAKKQGHIIVRVEDLENAFPELKESEDERIRKWLTDTIKSVPNDSIEWDVIDKSDVLAWLEKQGEQKPANKVESNKKFTPIESALKDLICDVDNSYTIEQVRRFLFEYGYKDKILNAAQEEMLKPAWSEEDEKIINKLLAVVNLYYDHSGNDLDKQSFISFLKSLKDRVQPKPVEWSALDERNLQGVIDEIQANKNNAPDYDLATYDRFLSWLKSLRPQNRWKPSDEQMEALEHFVRSIGKSGYDDNTKLLYSLLSDLKKLREG